MRRWTARDGRPPSSRRSEFRDRLGDLQQALADGLIGNLLKGAHQFQGLALGLRVGGFGSGLGLGFPRLTSLRRSLEKMVDGNIEDPAELEQAARSDAVRSALVFLNLLKGQMMSAYGRKQTFVNG